ncbi:putative nucleic acid-binding protein [Agave yellow streak virus Jalisco 1]|uniref:Nucleic acid-binding protein n=1 Tax=Agave yellow streak virus Jalisco 1 TaxID=3142681 RepID=A0A1X9ZMU2_9VIRU|nr:putative nucleic acid-binding protein [Agave tequilana leaf virus]ARS73026.1 putative nucleic acid-binding protein [Agave tequilana leaf virus]
MNKSSNNPWLLGESRSAAKRRAKRWGVCFCHGRVECANKQTNSQADVRAALMEPATRWLSKTGTRYVTNAIQHCLDDMEARGDYSFHKNFKSGNEPNGGARSPEETPWAYNWNQCLEPVRDGKESP